MSEYKYHYTHNEANFGKPIKDEVAGGAHIVFEIVLRRGGKLRALRRPEGLHGAKQNGLYFAHDLIRFGETIEDCVDRVVSDQSGMTVKDIDCYGIDSWVDDDKHWHFVVNIIASVGPDAHLPKDVSESVEFGAGDLPSDMPWWTKNDLAELFEYIEE